jgi:hypothetical protein
MHCINDSEEVEVENSFKIQNDYFTMEEHRKSIPLKDNKVRVKHP